MTIRLASLDRRSEDVLVELVVIPEFEFRDVERQIFAAYFVKASHDAAFDERPKAFDGLSVDSADDILAACMVNGVQRIFLRELAVSRRFVRAKQADFVRDGLANESGHRIAFQIIDDAGDDVALALHRPDDDRFASAARSAASVAALVLVPVLGEAADESFINLDDAAQLFDIISQGDADLVAHKPSGLVGTEAHIAVELERTHSLFADQHQVNDAIPVLERLVCVFKDRAGKVREAIALFRARVALPMPRHCRDRIDALGTAARATITFRPTARDQISDAVVFGLKQRVELRGGQLMYGFRLLCAAAHDDVLFECEEAIT